MQRLIGAGHAYADVLGYTLAQMNAFLDAIERQEARQMANLLSLIATGSQGGNDTLRRMMKRLSC